MCALSVPHVRRKPLLVQLALAELGRRRGWVLQLRALNARFASFDSIICRCHCDICISVLLVLHIHLVLLVRPACFPLFPELSECLKPLRILQPQSLMTTRLPPSCCHRRRVILQHLSRRSWTKPLRYALHIVARRPAPQLFGNALESARREALTRLVHSIFQRFDRELVRFHELVDVDLAVLESGAGALRRDRAGVARLCAFAVAAILALLFRRRLFAFVCHGCVVGGRGGIGAGWCCGGAVELTGDAMEILGARDTLAGIRAGT